MSLQANYAQVCGACGELLRPRASVWAKFQFAREQVKSAPIAVWQAQHAARAAAQSNPATRAATRPKLRPAASAESKEKASASAAPKEKACASAEPKEQASASAEPQEKSQRKRWLGQGIRAGRMPGVSNQLARAEKARWVISSTEPVPLILRYLGALAGSAFSQPL